MSETLIWLRRTRPAYGSAARLTGGSGWQVTELIAALVVLGFIAEWLATVYSLEHSFATVGANGKFVMQVVKPPLYYAAHGLAIPCVTVAGVLAVFDGRWRVLDFGARIAFWILLGEACIWAVIAYTTNELLSPKVFGATGPFVWITMLVLVAGTDRRLWNAIDPTLRALAYASSALAIHTVVTLKFLPFQGTSKYTEYTKLLLWLGGWTLLSGTRLTGWRLLPRLVPVICLVPVVLCSQSRSLTLDSCLLVMAFVVLRAREKGSIVRAVPILVGVCVLVCAGALAIYFLMPQTVDASINGLNARMSDDTRTGQYTAFFSVVPLSDLVLGRGPTGTWYWRGLGEYQFFDNGYLWMLFIGGLPTCCCYLRIVVWPAIRASFKKPFGDDAAAVYLSALWALCLTGLSVFTLPGIDVTNFAVLLFAGRCHLVLAESARRDSTRTINNHSLSRPLLRYSAGV